MIPRASCPAPLARHLRMRRWHEAVDALTTIATVVFVAVIAWTAGRMILTTLINLANTGTPPGCC